MLCAGWLVLNPGSNKRPLGDATWSVSGRSQETRREAGPDTWVVSVRLWVICAVSH